MSFFASNNRIHITNPDGKVIFDTDQPMPHIIQRVTAQLTVTFPTIAGGYKTEYYTGVDSDLCRRYENVYVCANRYSCQREQVCGIRDGKYQCWMENVCKNRYSCEYEWQWVRYPLHSIKQGFRYEAMNWEQTVEIAPVANGLAADFLLTNAVATRTEQGALIDAGPLPCGLPLGPTFTANNSSIIETVSDVADGQPWMTRIMSIFVEDGILKATFKHSNRAFESRSKWEGGYCNYSSVPPYAGNIPTQLPSSRSSYVFDLDISVGKFTM